MVRVQAGAHTKRVGKKLLQRPDDISDEDEPEESDRGSDDEGVNEEEEANDEDDAGDEDEDDDDEDEDEEEEEEEEDEDEDAAEIPKEKKKSKRNRFVDDVAEEDDDEDERGGKKSKKSKKAAGARRSEFIDDMADVNEEDDDEDEDGEEDEPLDDEEREALQRDMDTRMHARMANQGQFDRMENEEELERMIKERYAAPQYESGGRYELDDGVDQQALHPTVRDPKLWLVTVKLGKERETVVCLMQKTINLAKQGKQPMQILSCVAQDHLKGYIYVEAEREDQVRKALTGMRHVYHSKPIRLVPIKEMVDSISVVKKEVETVKVDSWVRMRTGVYKGDLANVVDVNYADNQCTVKLLPRIDYQHLADKESGAAKGKPKSQVRPPARLFSEAEAKRLNLSLEKGRFDRQVNDYIDILCGTTKIKDGYHMKTCSMATVKLADTPTLDELQKFAVGNEEEDNQGASGAGGALAAMSLAIGARKTDLKFMTGDQVVVVEGDLRNLEGVVERIAPDGRVVVNPSHKELNELLTFKPEQLRKHFKTGSTVRVLHGKHEGVMGMVVKVEGDVAHIFSTVSNEEFQVFMHDLADGDETTQRIDTLGEYALHDLAMLDGSEVGCIVRVEKDVAFVMTNAGTPERPEIKSVKLHDLKKKMFSRNISAQDAHMDTIDPQSMVRIIDGKYKDTTGTVEHIYKGTLWIRARHVQEHGGIVCIRARNCVVHGSNKSGQVGGGLAAQLMSSSGLAPKSPGHALLANSYTAGFAWRVDVRGAPSPAPRATPDGWPWSWSSGCSHRTNEEDSCRCLQGLRRSHRRCHGHLRQSGIASAGAHRHRQQRALGRSASGGSTRLLHGAAWLRQRVRRSGCSHTGSLPDDSGARWWYDAHARRYDSGSRGGVEPDCHSGARAEWMGTHFYRRYGLGQRQWLHSGWLRRRGFPRWSDAWLRRDAGRCGCHSGWIHWRYSGRIRRHSGWIRRPRR
jgi:transcription elongation factor SPT5